jgi:hypothetical protein
VITTYMVAKKILENWVYWLVIDGSTLYIYWQRELYLYAALFVVYLVLIVIGFYRWHRDWRAQPRRSRDQRRRRALGTSGARAPARRGPRCSVRRSSRSPAAFNRRSYRVAVGADHVGAAPADARRRRTDRCRDGKRT